MMRTIFSLFTLLMSWNVAAQFILKGNVADQSGAALPGVKVYIQNSTYGIITDFNGAYYLELPEKKTYLVQFKMLGMKDTVVSIDLQQKYTTLNMVLYEKAVQLESVDVVVKKENIANGIIRKVQDNRKKMAQQFENSICDTYFKTSLEREPISDKVADPADTLPARMSLIESFSKSTFISPNVYHEKILAHHDYSDKIEIASESVVDYYIDDIITPLQAVMVDPYIFYEKMEDGDFNLYQNMINLPKISEYPITSPIGATAFANYSFDLTNVFFEGDQKIYEIHVNPLFRGAALLEGSLYILDSLWIIKSFSLSVNPGSMNFFKQFHVIQDYEQIDGFWVPVRREFSYTIREQGYLITANTRVNHSNYIFNQSIDQKDFKNEISSYDEEAFSRDTAYWEDHRPIQLKPNELAFIAEQNRIDSIKQSEHYLDSVDAVFNKVTFFDVTLNGMGFRNRYKQQEIYISPLLNIDLFGVGGFRYQFGGSYSKKFKNAHRIKIAPTFNYGFNLRDLKYELASEYTFIPRKFSTIEFEIGDMYDRLTNQLNAVNYVFGGNTSVRNQSFAVAYRQELVNGFYGRIRFSYSDKQPIDTLVKGYILEFYDSIDNVFDFLVEPTQFERYRIALFEIKLQYRFNQKYIIKNNEKLIVGTTYPELEFLYRQAIPGIANSEANFAYWEAKIHDEINFGNFGDSRWKVIAGGFLSKEDLRIVEHKYFKAADIGFFSNPLNTHQTLDTALNTSSFYTQAFFLHHFNGLLINKIPVLRWTKLHAIAGVSILMIPEQNYYHTEFFAGIERKVKIKNEYLKFGIYYTAGLNTFTTSYFKFKIGVDVFNTFTNKWAW